jgi:hypothetical protein
MVISMADFEQFEEVGLGWSWVIVILFTVGILAWGVSLHTFVPDAPREWDFGAMPVAPGDTVYTTAKPPADGLNPPRQMEQLPEAQPPEGGLRP